MRLFLQYQIFSVIIARLFFCGKRNLAFLGESAHVSGAFEFNLQ